MNFLILIDNSFDNEYSKEFVERLKSGVDSLKHALNCDSKTIENGDINDMENYLKNIFKESEGYDNIIYIPSNMPLFNAEETVKLAKIHEENIAYFSYGENYPLGIVPFIIRRNAFDKLFNIIKNKEIKPSENSIRDIVFVDPNFFEIEISISRHDMRYYRLSLFADCKRNALLISRLINYKNYDDMVKAIKENPKIRRTLPAYIEIDVNNEQNAINKNLFKSGALFGKEEKNITLNDFKKIYGKLEDFCEDFHLSIGSFCEPLLNERIFDILDFASKNKKVKIYLETNALLLDEEKAKKLLNLQNERENIYVIIHLDCIDENIYNELYENGDLKTIMSNIDYYLLREPKNAYLQITKQKANFDHLTSYYKYFDKYKAKIIMQKYYTYRGAVEDNRIGDMSPLTNVGCWHLARDMFIDAYGDVYICRYDLRKEKKISSIYDGELEEIWKLSENYYAENVFGKLDFCKNCDEWYLYNF